MDVLVMMRNTVLALVVADSAAPAAEARRHTVRREPERAHVFKFHHTINDAAKSAINELTLYLKL